MPAAKDRLIWKLKARLKIVTNKMREYRWRYFCVKYMKTVLKVLANLLISILAELGVEYWKKNE